jgi:hypothetical protein
MNVETRNMKSLLDHGLIRFSFFVILISCFSSCGIYSFTGASISPEVKTISIQLFPSYAPLAPPNLPQTFTETLRDKFVSLTNLDMVNKGGDIQFEGSIVDYRTNPVAIQGNETAALNRLSVSIQVTYTDTKNEGNGFDKRFTRFADYDSNKTLTEVEQDLLLEINDQIIQDIFNESVVNW